MIGGGRHALHHVPYNAHMSGIPDILVIARGVIGLTTAYHLAGEGLRVTVVDQAGMGEQASWAGAGILPDADPDLAPTPFARLKAQSVRMYPGLSAALRDETGIDNGYRVCGGVELPEPGLRPRDLPTEEWHGPGAACEMLSSWLFPELTGGFLGPHVFGTHLPGMAQVRNPWHLRALEAACFSRGVTLLPGWPVRGFECDGGRVVAAVGDGGRIAAGAFLVSGGAWTGQLLAPLGVHLPIRPVRGQMLLLRFTPGRRHIVLRGKRYIVPREDGMVLVGSTEEEAGFDATTTEDALAGLRAFAREVNPHLGTAPMEKAWAGLRPASADGLPFLGAVPGFTNLHVAAGHFRAGLLLSPVTGVVMARLLAGRDPGAEMGPFAVGRA